ncbi:MAG TPA: radical SAM protein [Vicinamibacterales bacterium]|jgi:radical SAM protein with 4Fe4S-binding SPASM domain|nr:radical SAM protein [Vicinamibacterales bacterium]
MALLRTTTGRPSSPLKLNLCLTYWCQYRCKTCNIWQRKPSDELTTDEITALVRENPHVNWVDLTGGEIFLRSDIDDVLDIVVSGWRRLAILHFPTNGFLTDRIVASVKRIAGRGPAHLVVTVSVDGDEALNDEIRGIKGGFRRQLQTFNELRRIAGVSAAIGITLSAHNAGQLERTFAACVRESPGLTMDDVHLNVAQRSGHYYGNADTTTLAPDAASIRTEMQLYRRMRNPPRSAQQVLENAYLSRLDEFIATGRTPMPCHALRASCFIDPWGLVYPCITYSRPVGNLREHGMNLDAVWNGDEARRLQQEIWKGDCPQCWTACEAYQSILGNALALRWNSRTRRGAAAKPRPAATESAR